MKTLQDQLIAKGFSQTRVSEVGRESTMVKDKPKEHLTLRELEELMGTRRDRFKRVNGAVRRR